MFEILSLISEKGSFVSNKQLSSMGKPPIFDTHTISTIEPPCLPYIITKYSRLSPQLPSSALRFVIDDTIVFTIYKEVCLPAS